MAHPTALLIHDRNEFGWADIRSALDQLDIAIAAEVSSATSAIAQAKQVQPGLVIASSELEGGSSLSTLTEIRRSTLLEEPFIVFAHALDQLELVGFANLNLSGFLDWRSIRSVETIACTVRLALSGEITVGSWSIARDYFQVQRGSSKGESSIFDLSDFQRDLLAHRARGRTYAEIARLEGVSERQVGRAFDRLREKLDTPDQFTLGMKVAMLGLVPYRQPDW